MNRRKLLFVTPWEPRPTGSGPAIRAYHSLRALSEMYEPHVLILGFYSDGGPAGPPPDLRAAKWEYVRVRNFSERGRRPSKRLIDLSSALFSRLYEKPSEWRYATSSAIRRAAKVFRGVDFDLVHVYRMFAAPFAWPYIKKDPRIRKQLDLEQVESFARWRMASLYEANGNALKAWSLMHDAEQYRRIEENELSRWDRLYVSSDLDVQRLRKRVRIEPIEVLPNVVENFAPSRGSEQTRNPFRFLFVGQLDHYPNADAVRFFLQEIWPSIRRLAGQDVALDIVGTGGSDDLMKEVIRAPGTQWIGPVNDLQVFYEQADAVIAPVRAGGGTRVKVVEAFAHRVPVVATSVAAEGLDVSPERHLLVADAPLRFAQGCVRLVEDPELRNWLRQNAFDLYRESYLPKAMRDVLLASLPQF
ncbi:MAG: glycosyltransferase [Acidobacteria bacterium]|nr:glycosyltransferase [Acidobacteriota bacterium]